MKYKWKEEIKKIKNIPGMKAKLEYIWEYYYLWIIGIVAAVAFLIFAIHQLTTVLTENWFYITFTNTYADVGNKSDLWDGYVEYTGYDVKEKNVEFNNESYFDYEKTITGNSYFEAFVAYTDGGTLDAVTMEEGSLVSLGESGRLLDLNQEACKSIKEKYGDRFVYCNAYDQEYSKDPVPVGIDISDSILMTKYHLYKKSCVIGIGAQSKHLDAVEKFLDYIYEEED